MKFLISILLVIVCLLVFPCSTPAQVSVTGRISAEVVDVLGTSAGSQGASYTISAKYSAISTSREAAASMSINPAVFSIYGTRDATFEVKLPESPTTLISSNGLFAIQVSDWTATSDSGTDSRAASGNIQKVKVGATVRVSSGDENQKGVFAGSYQVTFVYNWPIEP